MKLFFAFVALLMFAAAVIFAAPEDRFLGAGFDGYDRSQLIQICDQSRFKGASYDGYALSSVINTNLPPPKNRGMVIKIR